ncbi:MAG: hypothetical protein NUV64_00140 [Parcubacteria group bacterium]|nr:hypothetical protein [Parcubacteria group bacterium]MCR4342455.1 hypothetical protein [Patescibacteria group bacterium]
MKKAIILSTVSFLVSFGAFIYILKRVATPDLFVHNHLLHGAVMIAVCLVSFFAAYRAYVSYSYSKNVYELFLALAFYIFGFIFLAHGVFVPGFLFFDEMLFDIFEHTGLFLGSILFLGLGLSLSKWREDIYNKRSKIIAGFIAATVAYPIFILGTPPIAEYIGSKLDIITGLTAISFLISALILLVRYKDAITNLILCLIVSFSILINIGIIPFFYEEWNIVWWYFHILTLVAFLIILTGLLRTDKYRITNNG